MQEKPLLILDLDETLVHACERDSEKDLRIRQHRQPDFFVGEYTIYKRPGVDEFLTRVYAVYQIAIWSKGGSGYVEPCVDELLKGFPAPVFVWSYRRCTRRFDHEAFEAYYIKDLKKVVKRGFAKERMLIVDDLPSNSERNFGNAVYIAPFEGEPEDAELEHLAAYLESLAPEPNFRTIEKRYWRHPRQEQGTAGFSMAGRSSLLHFCGNRIKIFLPTLLCAIVSRCTRSKSSRCYGFSP